MKRLPLVFGGLAALVIAGAALAGPPEGHRHRGGPEAGFTGGPGGPVDFVAIDTDGDGSLSRAELTARAVAGLATFDADGDGALDRAELAAAFPARGGMEAIFAAPPGEAAADRLLAMLGATAAGEVSVDEMATWRVNMLMTRFDDGRDDALSRDEVERTPGGPRGRGQGGPRP